MVATLIARQDVHEFVPGIPSLSMGYNGSYLGPTIVLDRGQEYEIRVRNELGEVTTVHWHGMDIQADADGGPRQPIPASGTWDALFDVHQPPNTAWYHPHAMGTTASQVAAGLAGMIIVRDTTTVDARQLETQLPHAYGVDDLPMIIQDRRLDAEGASSYQPVMPDIMHGFRGNTLVTNGSIQPVAEVPAGWVRLRLLNGSNSAYLQVVFPDRLNAFVIASDGGYLRAPVPVAELVLAAAERYEVLVDASQLDESTGAVEWITAVTDAGVRAPVLGLQSSGEPGHTSFPASLRTPGTIVEPGSSLESLPRRRFVLETRGMMSRTPFTINGRAMDLSRIDERIRLGTTEIWEIVNAGPMQMTHSFHVHSTHFQVVSIAGEPPPSHMEGRKDTVIVPAGSTVEIAVRFDRHRGVFMYHCHMLEHEESGLMGQIEVVE
jgi:FtsP/CotA-like multicopper oxidase with cupredoxin domain